MNGTGKEERQIVRTRAWGIPDKFRAPVEPLLPANRQDARHGCKRKPGGGRKAKYSDRLYFSGIVHVLRTGIVWNAFPREKFECPGSSALHARFQQWAKRGCSRRSGKKVWRNTTKARN
ncbi:MAG: transposase [Zoogloeaceae bacterium]|nr:transposase [Zoogloeaceae bacterium]